MKNENLSGNLIINGHNVYFSAERLGTTSIAVWLMVSSDANIPTFGQSWEDTVFVNTMRDLPDAAEKIVTKCIELNYV